jgi:long-chain fatty acid transport protein
MMNTFPKTTRLHKMAVLALLASPVTAALATDGYFPHGYGMKSKGMGGTSVAMTDSAFAGANNPAIAAWAGDRVEIGVDVFMPERSMDRSGMGVTKSDSNTFYVPEFGYNKKFSEQLGLGITAYGNGGMNTDYPSNSIPANGCGVGAPESNVFCGSGRLGVDLQQLIIAPTIAYKLNANHSIGISPLLVQQIFKVDGLQAFSGMSSSPQNMTNNGYDSSNGFGMRLGYLGKISDRVMIGASYAPRVSMSKLSKYAGLFAEQGGLDIPENFTVGLSGQATPEITLALDYQHIAYGAVRSIANPSAGLGGPLGAANGPGFAWKDINVVKLGVQWALSKGVTLRGGVNVSDNPIPSSDASFNTLAPGVITMHYTAGITYALSDTMDLTASYMVAPSNSVSGPNQGGGTDTIKMNQQSLGLQFGWHW